MNVQFQHPEFILALLALPFLALLFWYVLQWKKSVSKKIGDERLVRELTKTHSSARYLIKFILIAGAFLLVIIAIINPQRPGEMDKVERKGVDVMIALDVSNSMLAEDVKPNRLERAKQLVNRLMVQLANDRVGLVLFAGRAYMQMPLTTDHTAARMYVQNAGPHIVPTQGTMISDALKLCTSAFNSKERKYKAIMIITDGEDHDPASLELAEQLAAYGVIINTVGIGSPVATPIPDPATGQYRKDAQGNTVLSRLNDTQLKQLSALTKGVYVNTEDMNEATEVLSKQLATIQELAVEDAAFKDYIHYFPWFIAASLVLLFLEFLFSEKKSPILFALKKSANRKAALFVFPILIICAPVADASAQHINAQLREANSLYKQNKFEEALPKYQQSIAEGNNTPSTNYNLGNAFFRTTRFEEAAAAFDKTIRDVPDGALRQQSYYNLGVTYSKQQKLEQSIDAYKKAVVMDPGDEDARVNLQKALLELKKKQPPQPKKEDEKKKEQNKKDQQKQQPRSNLTKKQVEQLLKALQQREQQVQQKMQQNKSRSSGQQEKDW